MVSVPILSINNFFLFPHCENFLFLENENWRKIILQSLKLFKGYLIIVNNCSKSNDVNCSQKGILAKIILNDQVTLDISLEIITFQIKKIKLKGISRVAIISEEIQDGIKIGTYEELFDESNIVDERETTEKLIRHITEILDKNHLSSLDMTLINGNVGQVVDFIAQNSKDIDDDYKCNLLHEVNNLKRLDILIDLPNRKKVENDINELTRKNIRKEQEAYYLIKKKEAIEKKLKENRGYAGEEIKKILNRLEKEPFPSHIKEVVLQKIEQYETTTNLSSEGNVIRTYLNWIMKTPWWNESEDNFDLILAQKKLEEQHYGLSKIKIRIIEYLAAKQKAEKPLGQVLCFIGPPGVGKSSLSKSIADVMGRKFGRISLAGVSDEANIIGHRSTYVGAYPGRIIQTLTKVQTVNPVILIDEIDKMGTSYKGDPSYALLDVLDINNNNKFVDNYLGEEAPYDLSKVLFICTANSYNLPLPLLDRLEIIDISGYTEQEKIHISKNHLIPNEINKYVKGLLDKKVNFTDDALIKIINDYTRESGVRSLSQKIQEIIRKIIVRLLNKEKIESKITPNLVQKYLGKRLYHPTVPKTVDRPGIFNALAYCISGVGSIIQLEATYYPSKKPDCTFTGNLGKVIEESFKVALIYIKSMSDKFNIDPDFFTNNSINFHAAGSSSKDGPSAGVAAVITLLSAITGKSIPNYIGSTGQISLHGWIGAIGGVKEKALYAQMVGLKVLFFPKENQLDVESDVPKDIRDKIRFIFVENFIEVWQILFVEGVNI